MVLEEGKHRSHEGLGIDSYTRVHLDLLKERGATFLQQMLTQTSYEEKDLAPEDGPGLALSHLTVLALPNVSVVAVLVDLSDTLVLKQFADDVLSKQVNRARSVLRIGVQQLDNHDGFIHVDRGICQSREHGPKRLVSVSAHQGDDALLGQQVQRHLQDS